MDFLIDFFREVGEIFSMIVDFIIDFVKGIIQFFTDLPEYVETMYLYVEILPDPIKAIALLTISFTLIFVIIRRRGK